MTKLDHYKPARCECADRDIPRERLLANATREAKAGFLFSVCAWCHPPALTPDLKALDNITHSICAEHAAAQLKSLR